MRSGVLPRLVSVTLFGALVVCTRCGPKPRDVAESRTAVPVPLKLTVCGLLGSLSAMTVVADRTPAAVGLNARLIVQLASPATLPPATHELDSIAKSPAFVPMGVRGAKLTTLRLEMLSGVLPRFVSVTVFRELLPTSCAPKLSDAAERLTAVPIPVRLTVCGLFAALSLIESVAARLPVAEGVKVTLTAQVPSGITVAPEQVSALFAKSLAFVPPIVTVDVVRLTVPVLVTVSVWVALVVLRGWLPKLKPGADKLTRGGLLIVKVSPPDVPPPGDGFTTVTEAVPAVVMSLAKMAAVTCVALTKVVARALPFHCTAELETKLVPVTVSVNAAPLAVALEGESELAVGAGLLMVKVREFDAPPLGEGLTTVTEAVPAVAGSVILLRCSLAGFSCIPRMPC